MQKEKLGYKVFVWGESMQIIEVVLDPGKTIPAGAIFNNWIEGGINYDRRIAGVRVLNRSDTKTYFHAKLSGSGTVYLQSKPFKISKHAQSLTHDIRELANTKAIQLYKGNLEKIKSFQWSTLQGLIKTENLKNTLKKKVVLSGGTIKLTDKNS